MRRSVRKSNPLIPDPIAPREADLRVLRLKKFGDLPSDFRSYRRLRRSYGKPLTKSQVVLFRKMLGKKL